MTGIPSPGISRIGKDGLVAAAEERLCDCNGQWQRYNIELSEDQRFYPGIRVGYDYVQSVGAQLELNASPY